jgi:ubiquinone/menaquinone biosynthesis C-methylase UbiE
MAQNGELSKYLYNKSEESSYFADSIMDEFEHQYNASHILSYKQTLLKFVEGKTLETCAGSNRNLQFYPPGTNLTLIDWSPKMVAVGNTKTVPAITSNYVIGDVTKMPFSDNEFDTVVDMFGLEQVAEPLKALQEMRRYQIGNIECAKKTAQYC